MPGMLCEILPVSYTHLDVYKRQVREHAAIIAGFERHDVAYVRAAMHTHLENQIEAVRMAIREQE